MFDRVDEWLMSHPTAFQDAGKGELDLGKLDSEDEKEAQEKPAEEAADRTGKPWKATSPTCASPTG